MTTNTRSANARTLPTRRDALGALFTTGTAAVASAGLLGATLQPAPADPIGELITARDRLALAVAELKAAALAAFPHIDRIKIEVNDDPADLMPLLFVAFGRFEKD